MKTRTKVKNSAIAVARKMKVTTRKKTSKTNKHASPAIKTLSAKTITREIEKKFRVEEMRYSPKELNEFKNVIIDKLNQAKKDLELLKSTLCYTDNNETDDTSPTFKVVEDGSNVETKEETAHLALRQEKFITNLQNALIRIQNKTYGICRITGNLIPRQRLMSVPHATLCIDAKMEQQFN